MTVADLAITPGYRPGLIGALVRLHADYYAQHWGFGLTFEALVARELAELLARSNPPVDGIWSAWQHERLAGAVAIAGALPIGSARLRFFIVDPTLHGAGLGRRLLQTALAHCDRHGIALITLTTFGGLDAARHLYQQAGFMLTHEAIDTSWGVPVSEQLFERRRPPGAVGDGTD